jgi:hypothetical protein
MSPTDAASTQLAHSPHHFSPRPLLSCARYNALLVLSPHVLVALHSLSSPLMCSLHCTPRPVLSCARPLLVGHCSPRPLLCSIASARGRPLTDSSAVLSSLLLVISSAVCSPRPLLCSWSSSDRLLCSAIFTAPRPLLCCVLSSSSPLLVVVLFCCAHCAALSLSSPLSSDVQTD